MVGAIVGRAVGVGVGDGLAVELSVFQFAVAVLGLSIIIGLEGELVPEPSPLQ
jgi:hypothetical protein